MTAERNPQEEDDRAPWWIWILIWIMASVKLVALRAQEELRRGREP